MESRSSLSSSPPRAMVDSYSGLWVSLYLPAPLHSPPQPRGQPKQLYFLYSRSVIRSGFTVLFWGRLKSR